MPATASERRGLCPDDDDEILVVGYLSAVAAALDERGVAVMAVHLHGSGPVDGPGRQALSGAVIVRPARARRDGWGPTRVGWHQGTGWSVRLCGANGHDVRHLPGDPVPAPPTVAEFVIALTAGHAVGTAVPLPSRVRRHTVLGTLGRFAVPEPW